MNSELQSIADQSLECQRFDREAHRKLLRAATRQSDRLKVIVATGSSRDIKRQVRHFLTSFAVRYRSAFDVLRKKRFSGGGISLADLHARALVVSSGCHILGHIDEMAHARTRLKRNGQVRVIVECGPVRSVAQRTIAHALRIISPPPPWQYEHKGRGVSAAIRAVESAAEEGFSFAAYADIRDFYQSFDAGLVLKALPLPEGSIRHHVTLSAARYASVSGAAAYRRHTNMGTWGTRPVGIPQGTCCSNLVASALLVPVANAFRDDVRLICYRDDILILTKTRRKASACILKLRGALASLPTGRLSLKQANVFTLRKGAHFLGYSIYAHGGKCWSMPGRRNQIEADIRTALLAYDAYHAGDDVRTHVEVGLKQWAASFPAWDEQARNIWMRAQIRAAVG